MQCKFCKTENVDDSVYCKKCGKRVDGNKVCTNCKKLIADDAIYCNYCGTRLDGKNVCPSCNEEFVGSYCPKCGTTVAPAVEATHNTTDAAKTVNTKTAKWQSIVSKVGHSMLLFGVVMALIFVFFIGFGVKLNTNVNDTNINLDTIAQSYGISTKVSMYDYFGTMYKTIAAYEENLIESTNIDMDYVVPAMYITAVLGTIIAAGTLVAVTVLAIISIVKLARKLMGKEAAKAERLGIATILVYVLGIALLFALNCGSVYMSETSTTTLKTEFFKVVTVFNDATVAGIVMCAIPLGLSVMCFIAKRGSELTNVKKLVPSIVTLVGAVFAIIVVHFGSQAVYTLQASSQKISMSTNSWLVIWATNMQHDTNLGIAPYVEFIIMMLLQMVIVILAAIALIKLLTNLVEDNKSSALGINIVLLVVAIGYLALTIIATKQPLDVLDPNYNNKIKIIFTSAIVTMVFAVLGAAASIARTVLYKSFNATNANQAAAETTTVAQ